VDPANWTLTWTSSVQGDLQLTEFYDLTSWSLPLAMNVDRRIMEATRGDTDEFLERLQDMIVKLQLATTAGLLVTATCAKPLWAHAAAPAMRVAEAKSPVANRFISSSFSRSIHTSLSKTDAHGPRFRARALVSKGGQRARLRGLEEN
jgi:hypothetical protein